MLADDLARTDLAKTIDAAFERREEISPATTARFARRSGTRSTFSIAAPPASRKRRPTAPGASING
jgi:hypothetical protein